MKSTVDELIARNNKLATYSLIVLAVFITLLVTWSVSAKLSSAAIAPGMIVVENKRKSIQHLNGGVVYSVFVSEGDEVVEGQPLIKIADLDTHSSLIEANLSWVSMRLEYQRLIAERNGEEVFKPDFNSDEYAGLELEFQTIVSNQQSLFTSRKTLRSLERTIISSRMTVLESKAALLSQKLVRNRLARSYLLEEIGMHEKLIENGYTSRLKLLELNRSKSLLEAEIISITAEVDSVKQSLEELAYQKESIIQRDSAEIEQLIVQAKNALISADAKLKIARDSQARSLINSPSDGVVQNIKIHAAGQVVQAGETVMEVVPTTDRLIVEAMLSPNDIDMVRSGQIASVRLSALNQRRVPPVEGKVVYVDADVTEVPDEGVSGFKVKVMLDLPNIEREYKVNLTPGMPAEVYVLLEDKRPLDYLLEPISDSLYRAFREQ